MVLAWYCALCRQTVESNLKLPDPSNEVAEAGMGGDCYMRKLLKMNGGRDRTRTCDLLRVKDVKMGKYLSFQGAFAAFAA